MKATTEQAENLVRHGTLDIGNGYLLRYKHEPDDFTEINDYDCYGKVHHCFRDNTRPKDFDGMAEKVATQSDVYWWQPPEDLRKDWHNYEHKNSLRNTVREILSFGFYYVKVELCKGKDAYGQPIVVDFQCVGNIEPLLSYKELADYVYDLMLSLDLDTETVLG